MIIFFSTRSSDMLTSLPHWSNSLVFIQHTQCKFNVRKWVDEQWTKSVNSLQRSGFRANRRWFTDVVHVRDTCCAIVTGTILRNNAQLVSAYTLDFAPTSEDCSKHKPCGKYSHVRQTVQSLCRNPPNFHEFASSSQLVKNYNTCVYVCQRNHSKICKLIRIEI